MAKIEKVDLTKIQANILKGHSRHHAAFLLIKFKETAIKKVKKQLSKLKVTSVEVQKEQSAEYKKSKKETLVLNFYLTIDGYKVLEIPEEERPCFKTKEQAFATGMFNRGLGDPKVSNWESCYQEKTALHGMLSIASNNLGKIQKKIKKLEKKWDGVIEVLHIQWGQGLKNEQDEVIEHFGYRDGISQPIFEVVKSKEDLKKDKAQHLWSDLAPLDLVLVKENGTDSYGSYLVFRKLEQNVEAFKNAEKDLAHELGLHGEAEEMVGAMMVGRFENGLPIVKMGSVSDAEAPSKDNNFNYSLDVEGKRCPFHSHIRKVNPRGDAVRLTGMKETEEVKHRIVRRGIPYDEIGRNGDLGFHPTRGVGLLFLCFQSSIENQFEFIQKTWANNNDFPVPFTGIDPVIGQGENRTNTKGEDAEQKWNGIDGCVHAASLANFVRMKGGAYFFAPSLSFIQQLS
ncbi:MAG: Dyp-type peroxidase family [Aureispira sp.]|jgi:Dyp-type peroxidase family